ncbi:MAG: site-specific integrase, partial [Deltaproteobacteria bacterium]|nr:site-specific integrase [Deltaproteobacteria bacterium]
LRWQDTDLDAGTVTIHQTLVHLEKGKWQFGTPKTPQSRRTIPLPISVLNQLRTHRVAQAKHRLKMGEAYTDLDLVFASELGGPSDAQNLAYRVLKPALKAAGLPKEFRWYDCRHTCATLLLAAGENAKVVSERLGHATVAFTLDRYAHVMPGMQEQASEKLEAMLFGSGS